MKKIETRIKRIEKQLTPDKSEGAILVLPEDDENQLIREYLQQHPGQPRPMIIRISFPEPTGELFSEGSEDTP